MDNNKKLAAARAALASMSESPRQRGQEKTRLALDWIYRWGWASPTTIELVGGAHRSGLAARLVRNGLLRSTQTEAGGAVRGVPAHILTLTETGQAEIERLRDDLLPYDRDPYHIRQDQLRHYQLAQTATAKALKSCAISGFITEKEVGEASVSGVKQADVTWLIGDIRSGVEVELTAKWSRDLDTFVRSCLLALSPQGADPARFQYIYLVSDSPAIIKRYRAAFAPGASYSVWKKDGYGRWKTDGSEKVPAWAGEKMLWQLIENK